MSLICRHPALRSLLTSRDARPDDLALLGGHNVDITRHKRHLLAPALGAFWFHGFMLGDGLDAFKLLPAFFATILAGGHGSTPAACKEFYGRHPDVEKPILGRANYRAGHIQRLATPGDVQP